MSQITPYTWDNVGKHYTANGVLITPGLRVRDYNGKETTVSHPDPYRDISNVQWFRTANRGLFDGSRLWALDAPPLEGIC